MTDPERVIVFDLDDTLYLERDYVRSGFDAVGAFLLEVHGIASFAPEAWQLFESGVRGVTFNLALENLGHRPSEALVKEAVRIYRAHRPAIALLPDAAAALEAARAASNTALITDGPVASQQAKVDALGLSERIGCIVLSDAYGVEHRKPSPLPYRKVMAHFDVSGVDCVYLGDNPRKDFIGARRLGWQTIRVRRPLGEHAEAEPESGYEPDEEWADLSPLAAWLET